MAMKGRDGMTTEQKIDKIVEKQLSVWLRIHETLREGIAQAEPQDTR